MRAEAAWTTKFAAVLLAVFPGNTRKMALPIVSTVSGAAPQLNFQWIALSKFTSARKTAKTARTTLLATNFQ
jgi:hypothetical protein